MARRDIHQWLAEYGVSHQNPTNKAIHWICVPLIYFCVLGLLWSVEVPDNLIPTSRGIVAKVAVTLVAVFYARLSLSLMFGMLAFSVACLAVAYWVDLHAPWPLWVICLVLFVLAWLGQFYGHKVEGKKPSFLEDLQFLMIGPAWLMSSLYQRMGIPY